MNSLISKFASNITIKNIYVLLTDNGCKQKCQ